MFKSIRAILYIVKAHCVLKTKTQKGVKTMAKAITEKKAIAGNKTLTKTLKLYLEKKAVYDALDAEIKEHRGEIIDFLTVAGTKDALYTSENQEVFTLTLSDIERTNVNSTLLAEKYPEIFEAVTSKISFPRLNVVPKNKAQVQGIIETKKQLIADAFKIAI